MMRLPTHTITPLRTPLRVSLRTPTMARPFSSYIVTPRELSTALSSPAPAGTRIIPVSAEWYLPNSPRRGIDEFHARHIARARFFDLDAIKDHSSAYPHMVPDAATFSAAMTRLRIRRDDTVVVYDSPYDGIFSAPRAAWTFRLFGHPKVHLLNNFKTWVEEGYPVVSGGKGELGAGVEEEAGWDGEGEEYPLAPRDETLVALFEEMKEIAEKGGDVQVLDARPEGRFLGVDPEPRPGLSSGHLPGAVSVPFSALVDPATKELKTPEELREVFASRGVDINSPTEKRLMCGTGVTAVVIDAALERAGVPGPRKIYDGSWTEWAQRVDENSGLIVKKPKA